MLHVYLKCLNQSYLDDSYNWDDSYFLSMMFVRSLVQYSHFDIYSVISCIRYHTSHTYFNYYSSLSDSRSSLFMHCDWSATFQSSTRYNNVDNVDSRGGMPSSKQISIPSFKENIFPYEWELTNFSCIY